LQIPAEFHAWVDSANSTVIIPMKRLLDFIKQKGFHAIFITGRKDVERAATIRNLDRVNIPSTVYDTLILRTPDSYPPVTAATFKSHERQVLTEQQGYEIVGCVGDQVSDCTGGWVSTAARDSLPPLLSPCGIFLITLFFSLSLFCCQSNFLGGIHLQGKETLHFLSLFLSRCFSLSLFPSLVSLFLFLICHHQYTHTHTHTHTHKHTQHKNKPTKP
jgi:hypothetical protein